MKGEFPMFRIVLSTGILLSCLLCWSTMNADAKVRGYWAFNSKNDIGKDSGPFRNDGELKGEGTAEWTAKGKVGGGLQLSNGWLEIPHDNSLNLKDQMTLMCWVKFTNPGDFEGLGREQSLIWKNAPFQTNKRFWASYALRLFRREFKAGFAFDANMTEGRAVTADEDQPKVDEWLHATAIADGAKVKVYANGVEKASVEQRGEFQPTELPLTIGVDLRNPKAGAMRRDQLGFLAGAMDEVVILNHALTAGQIQQAMKFGEAGQSLEEFQPVFAVESHGKLATQWGEIKVRN
jgi:hypothetical protein